MRRIICTCLVAFALAAISGCGGDKKKDEGKKDETKKAAAVTLTVQNLL